MASSGETRELNVGIRISSSSSVSEGDEVGDSLKACITRGFVRKLRGRKKSYHILWWIHSNFVKLAITQI